MLLIEEIPKADDEAASLWRDILRALAADRPGEKSEMCLSWQRDDKGDCEA